jgi:hypothetical protein
MSTHKVLAATLVTPGQYELREYPLPEPAPGYVLVKMELSGICGADKHTFQGYATQYGGVCDASLCLAGGEYRDAKSDRCAVDESGAGAVETMTRPKLLFHSKGKP